jgi:hypothetical protein
MWVENERTRVVVVLEMRVLCRKWEMTDYQNGSLIGGVVPPGNDNEIHTVQLGIVAHGRTDTNHDAVVHSPHPFLRNTEH